MVTKEQKEQIIAEYGRTAGATFLVWAEKVNDLDTCL